MNATGSESVRSVVFSADQFTDDLHLLQIETAGNQAFIFDTNKLRLNIGSSQLLYVSCRTWVEEAIDQHPHGHEMVRLLITSGRALIGHKNGEHLREVLRTVTARVLTDAPGLTVTGSVVRLGDHADAGGEASTGTRIGRAIRQLSEDNERMAGAVPMAGSRFPQVPIIEVCGISGLPIERTVQMDGGRLRVSESVRAAAAAAKAGHARISGLFSSREGGQRVTTLDDLERNMRQRQSDRAESVGWLAMIAIDGSGIGQLFIGLAQRIAADGRSDAERDAEHCTRMLTLSTTLERAAEAAMKAAIGKVGSAEQHVIPIVVGGDDIAVITSAHAALELTRAYLEQFEEETKQLSGELPVGRTRLSAGAGIAVIKPHFPFHSAHSLAEQLMDAAKTRAKSAAMGLQSDNPPRTIDLPSTIDIHVLADSVFTELDLIRERRCSRSDADERFDLWGGPYLVGQSLSDPAIAPKFRSLDWLDEQLRELWREDDGRRVHPRTKLHRLRNAMLTSAASADREVEEWSGSTPWEVLGGDSKGLWVGIDKAPHRSNALLDLLDFADPFEPMPEDDRSAGRTNEGGKL